jgi:GNAT superfamily N-acetyltransferase
MKARNAYCSFCRKHYREVGPLVEGPCEVFICGDCVELCQSIFMSQKQQENFAEAQTPSPNPLTLRHDLNPGDVGYIVYLHGTLYAKEYGFDPTFEAYVAGPLSEFVRHRTDCDRLWIAERDGEIVGCIAIVGVSETEAQLRWFLVDPSARGQGLGKTLIEEAVAFCRSCRYESVFLWTVSALITAAHLYRSVGFEKVEEKPGRQWGVEVVEEKYLLWLSERRP